MNEKREEEVMGKCCVKREDEGDGSIGKRIVRRIWKKFWNPCQGWNPLQRVG
jgi:hypothetical protein